MSVITTSRESSRAALKSRNCQQENLLIHKSDLLIISFKSFVSTGLLGVVSTCHRVEGCCMGLVWQ